MKKCYVCQKEAGWGKMTFNPTNKLKKRYICLTTKNNLCYKILWELATWGNCDGQCCSTYHMSRFDLDELVENIKNGQYIHNYTKRAIELLKPINRL